MGIDFKLIDGFEIESNQDLDKFKFKVQSFDYMFRRKVDNIYRVRKLSNTQNSNVIFSVQLLKNQNFEDLELFINSL